MSNHSHCWQNYNVPMDCSVGFLEGCVDVNGAGMGWSLEQILKSARTHQASDVHLIRDVAPVVRTGGEIRPLAGQPLAPDDLQSLFDSLLNDAQKKLFEKEWHACFSRHLDGIGRFRVSVYL